jgi:hypothetical protein
VLACLGHRSSRLGFAMLCAVGVLLAASVAPRAWTRLGAGSGLTFTAVAVGLAVLGFATVRGARWALVVDLVGFGGQVFGVAGSAWQLVHGVDPAKARELRALGFAPATGVAINLVYSAVAFLVFLGVLWHWAARCRRLPAGRDRAAES